VTQRPVQIVSSIIGLKEENNMFVAA